MDKYLKQYEIFFNKAKVDYEELIPLTDYAVEGRYAIMHDDLSDVDKYIEILSRLIEFVKTKIS